MPGIAVGPEKLLDKPAGPVELLGRLLGLVELLGRPADPVELLGRSMKLLGRVGPVEFLVGTHLFLVFDPGGIFLFVFNVRIDFGWCLDL